MKKLCLIFSFMVSSFLLLFYSLHLVKAQEVIKPTYSTKSKYILLKFENKIDEKNQEYIKYFYYNDVYYIPTEENEIERTNTSVIYQINSKLKTGNFYPGVKFWKDDFDLWREVKQATATPENFINIEFNKPTLLEALLNIKVAWADQFDPSATGAGYTYCQNTTNWNTARNSFQATVSNNNINASAWKNTSTGQYWIERAFFGDLDITAIDAGSIITDAYLSIVPSQIIGTSRTVGIYLSTSSDPVLNTDFLYTLEVNNPTNYMNPMSYSAFSVGVRKSMDTWNSTGLSYIEDNAGGYISFSLREASKDVANVAPTDTSVLRNYGMLGGANDPYMVITWEEPPEPPTGLVKELRRGRDMGMFFIGLILGLLLGIALSI